jgi:hypothetical protein
MNDELRFCKDCKWFRAGASVQYSPLKPRAKIGVTAKPQRPVID